METKKLKLKRIECISEIHGYEEIIPAEQMKMKGGQDAKSLVTAGLGLLGGGGDGTTGSNNSLGGTNSSNNNGNSTNSGNTTIVWGLGNNVGTWYNPNNSTPTTTTQQKDWEMTKKYNTTTYADGSEHSDSTVTVIKYK